MKYLIRLSLTVSISLLFFISRSQQADGGSTKSVSEKMDEYLNSAFKMYRFNGSVLVAQRGKILLQKGYGLKDVVSRTLNDSNSVFMICSITKQFTAAVILKLQEQGKLSVHDPLNKYFPGYPNGDKITLQNLLDHTSGIHNYTEDIGPEDSAIVCYPVTKQRVMDVFYNKPLEFKPGTKFSYCNSGYFLLGMIIEKLTGKPYEQAVREIIFEPLQMTHSGFDFIHLQDESKTTAYETLNADKQIPARLWDSTVTYAAGAIYSSCGDIYKWARAIAANQILSKDSWKQAFTPHLGNYGYGWWIDSLYGKNYVTHSGGVPGFMSNLMYYPGEDVTIILLNDFGNYGESLLQLNTGLSAIVFNKPYALFQTHTAVKVDESILKQYVGVYALDPKHLVVITLENGQLQVESRSGHLPKSPLYASAENKFFLKVVEAELEFVKDVNGKVTKLISHANGKDDELKKIK